LMKDVELGRFLGSGTFPEAIAEFRRRVRDFIEQEISPLVDEAERSRQFPREAIAALGRSGLLRERWNGGRHGDLGRSVLLAEEIGYAGLGGVGVGLSLHSEAATATLRQNARSDYAKEILEKALDGEIVCCVATSEQQVGSDLSAVTTELKHNGDRCIVRGTKWFVSPGGRADVVLVLCRAEDGPAIAMVTREGLSVVKKLQTAGMCGLETVRLTIDSDIPAEAMLVRPGNGLLALTSALSCERLAVAALFLGTAELALTLAVTHLHRRTQFGQPLLSHQALRLRVADLRSQVMVTKRGLYTTVAYMSARGIVNVAEAAALKVTATRLCEHVISECMHIFGGRGYTEDETPFPRLWRDVPSGRLGAGTDEVMWEIVASSMRADDALYDRWITG
ncbi:MAG TPA: acyl-CoA dehydrogenase family protein, partial [Streptosporangiaceae bacterium]